MVKYQGLKVVKGIEYRVYTKGNSEVGGKGLSIKETKSPLAVLCQQVTRRTAVTLASLLLSTTQHATSIFVLLLERDSA
jgi:hypothetical protein